jgi:hypothetical protein
MVAVSSSQEVAEIRLRFGDGRTKCSGERWWRLCASGLACGVKMGYLSTLLQRMIHGRLLSLRTEPQLASRILISIRAYNEQINIRARRLSVPWAHPNFLDSHTWWRGVEVSREISHCREVEMM